MTHIGCKHTGVKHSGVFLVYLSKNEIEVTTQRSSF